MKICIKGTPKEMADLVVAIQSQPGTEEITENVARKITSQVSLVLQNMR